MFFLTSCEEAKYSEDTYFESFAAAEHIVKIALDNVEKMTCEAGMLNWDYVYNDEYLLEYYYMGKLIEDGSEVDGVEMDYESFVTLAGGINAYITNTKQYMEELVGATCEFTE